MSLGQCDQTNHIKFIVVCSVSSSSYSYIILLWITYTGFRIEFGQTVLIQIYLLPNMSKDSELECPFCHEGTMREDNCGCLTCRRCHRVEGTNCNIGACQNARFSTCN